MPIFSSAGAKVFIGGQLGDDSNLDAADFATQTWKQVKHVETIGSFGDSSEEITFATTDRDRAYRLKGVRNAGNLEITCGLDYTDAGQLAMVAAEKELESYAFKIEFSDKPSTGSSPKNSSRLFCGKVMSVGENIDTANSVTTISFSVAIDSNVVRVAASGS